MLKYTNDFLGKSKNPEKDRDGLDALIKFWKSMKKNPNENTP